MDIHQNVLAKIEQEALAAYPKEACGLLVGKGDHIFEAVATRNLAKGSDAFLIDPELHLKTQRAARARGLGIIGCYHSHPNGDSNPSNRDWQEKNGAGFLWMITSLEKDKFPETRIFRQLNASPATGSQNFVRETLQIHRFVA